MRSKPNPTIPVTRKYVKGRKDYPCSTCKNTIPKGTPHLHETGRIWGYWINDRYCNNCDLKQINSLIDEVKEPLLKIRASSICEFYDIEEKK